MEEIRITVKRQKKELRWLCGCIIVAFLVNVYAIMAYQTSWTELWTQLIWVGCIGTGLYVITLIIRCLLKGIKQLLIK
ncbi:MAG: hypothetical protein LBR49_08800 [Tannerella sp.]|nr:hypothetical protein [Tannerella sp.]